MSRCREIEDSAGNSRMHEKDGSGEGPVGGQEGIVGSEFWVGTLCNREVSQVSLSVQVMRDDLCTI